MARRNHLTLPVSLKLNCVIKIDNVWHVSLLWKRRQPPILSRQTSELLAILKIEINSASVENFLREFEGSFVGVEKFRDFQVKLHVDESFQPIDQKLRASPFGVREEIEEKLEELVSHDIIEPVEGSMSQLRGQPLG